MLRKIICFTLLSLVFPQGYNMELVSFMDFGQNVSDITGFYQDGREFAVIGLQDAASFVDITDIVLSVNMIISIVTDMDDYALWAADYNSDSIIDILDLVNMINYILSQP